MEATLLSLAREALLLESVTAHCGTAVLHRSILAEESSVGVRAVHSGERPIGPLAAAF